MTDEELIAVTVKESSELSRRTKPVLEEVLTRIIGSQFQVPGMAGMLDAKIVPFGDASDVKAGFDVIFRDGSHLEFTVQRTGWGSPVGMDVPKDWFEKVGKV